MLPDQKDKASDMVLASVCISMTCLCRVRLARNSARSRELSPAKGKECGKRALWRKMLEKAILIYYTQWQKNQ